MEHCEFGEKGETEEEGNQVKMQGEKTFTGDQQSNKAGEREQESKKAKRGASCLVHNAFPRRYKRCSLPGFGCSAGWSRGFFGSCCWLGAVVGLLLRLCDLRCRLFVCVDDTEAFPALLRCTSAEDFTDFRPRRTSRRTKMGESRRANVIM
jgi:hypothetical protein